MLINYKSCHALLTTFFKPLTYNERSILVTFYLNNLNKLNKFNSLYKD